ncbi:MAG: hypothetical protein ACW98W_19745 [Candidatus Hodarchaeales archaeon]|jgi:hypothetical protein
MPTNNTGKMVKDLYQKYPEKMALLLNPQCYRPSQFNYRYAVDNNAFIRFDEKMYFNFLDKTKKYDPPMWIVSPDIVGCHDRTFALWHYYYARLKSYGYPIAFVCQDGCKPELIPDEADWWFIGGSPKTDWKATHLLNFTVNKKKPIHVGRVNSVSFAKYCEILGVDSVDGTGMSAIWQVRL